MPLLIDVSGSTSGVKNRSVNAVSTPHVIRPVPDSAVPAEIVESLSDLLDEMQKTPDDPHRANTQAGYRILKE